MATNREVLIQGLTTSSDFPIEDYIECPYYRDEDCKNSGKNLAICSAEYEENCRYCKLEWLNKEWDS